MSGGRDEYTAGGGESAAPKNAVHVSTQRSKFVYVDLTKHLLSRGEEQVYISALGIAINAAVDVVEMLKSQGMIIVTKIETSRSKVNRNTPKDTITITVKKSRDFDVKHAQSLEEREARKGPQHGAPRHAPAPAESAPHPPAPTGAETMEEDGEEEEEEEEYEEAHP